MGASRLCQRYSSKVQQRATLPRYLGSIVSYEWEFGDGAKVTGPIATHTFTTPGSYDVTLITTDIDRAEAFGYSPQTIKVPKPSAAAV